MASTKISLQEDSILKLILEFLTTRKLYKAARALEKEASIVNCPYSENVTFLRELVLDGEWDAVEDFAQPLDEMQDFDCRRFHYLVTKQKYLEILFEKCEGNVKDEQALRDSLVSCLNSLQKYCPFKDQFNKLYWYLSVPSLREEPEFSKWNVDSSRMVLFEEIISLLKPIMPLSSSEQNSSTTQRLLDLVSEGLLYENCIEFCQKQAMHKTTDSDFNLTEIRTDFFRVQQPKSCGNFYSWLHSLAPESFVIPFEELNIEVELERQKRTRACVDIKNNALSRSLTLESGTPYKSLYNGCRKDERRRPSDWKGVVHHDQFEFNIKDVSQSCADFDFLVSTDKDLSDPVGEVGDKLFTEEVAVPKPKMECDSRFKTSQSPIKMRKNQQEVVLQRLEEHKRRQQELHQQLAEMTANLGKENGNLETLNVNGDNNEVTSGKSFEALQKSKESFRFLNEIYKSPKASISSTNNIVNSASVRGKKDTGEKLKALVDENKHFVFPQPTPSSRPQRISIPDESHMGNDSSQSLSMPTSATVPKTPVNNVLPPGLVNLTDGSGVFNTSTPKSHRQAFMTPPPPTSPVISEQKAPRDEKQMNESHQDGMNPQEIKNFKKSEVDALNLTPKSTFAGAKQSVVRRSLVNDILEKEKGQVLGMPNDAADLRITKPTSTKTNISQMNHVPEQLVFHKTALLADTQAIRSVAFHPSGNFFAVGTNSKALKVCSVKNLKQNWQTERNDQDFSEPEVVFKKIPVHRGSVYCVAFSPKGDIIATGSNDKVIKVLKFDEGNIQSLQDEMELAIHSATVRDLTFVNTAGSLPLLASGGAGGGLIYLSDCWTGKTVSSLQGHAGNIMAIFASLQTNLLCSGSADKSVRLWDLRISKCIDVISTSSCVASVCFSDETDRMLLASAHENGQCIIYDVSARKQVATFQPHNMDCRSVRFSPDSKYILTGSYDTNIAIATVQYGVDSKMMLHPQFVAKHRDKVIQCRWHPSQYSFLSSSADKTVVLWKQKLT